MRKGESTATGVYHQFGIEVLKAEATAGLNMAQEIHAASEHDWRADALWLERRSPDERGQRQSTVFGRHKTWPEGH